MGFQTYLNHSVTFNTEICSNNRRNVAACTRKSCKSCKETNVVRFGHSLLYFNIVPYRKALNCLKYTVI